MPPRGVIVDVIFRDVMIYVSNPYPNDSYMLCSQAWDSQEVHTHEVGSDASAFAEGYFPSNFCRMQLEPNGTGRPWCYTTDLGTRWEVCGVPQC